LFGGNWTFRRISPHVVSPPCLDDSPTGRFTTWTVRPRDVFPPRRFAPYMVRPLDGSLHTRGRFATWTICPVDVWRWTICRDDYWRCTPETVSIVCVLMSTRNCIEKHNCMFVRFCPRVLGCVDELLNSSPSVSIIHSQFRMRINTFLTQCAPYTYVIGATHDIFA